jgi:aspartyl-tRNA(Asn)/glutamyl-tRNA(Gln) amidotransferase subunit A
MAALAPFETAIAVRDAVRAGTTTAEAVCAAALARVERLDGRLHAFHHVAADRALARARALDRAARRDGALHGVPVAIKDNMSVAGVKTTAGSRVLAGYVPVYDATVIEKLEAAGAVVIGKTICDEFSMGSSTENSAFGPARNPWDTSRIPGGSSGGSAVAVAAGLTPLALGSDTGGSIRQPAALCGIVGLKPTYGRVSRYGLIAFASSLDQIGPFSRSVADAALCLDVISGHDPRDSTASTDAPPSFSDALDGSGEGLRIGVPYRLLDAGVDPAVVSAFDASLETLRGLGARVEPIELPHSKFAIPTYYLVAMAEASSNLARYDGVRYGTRAPGAESVDAMYDLTRDAGFGAEVKRRVMIGTYVLSAGYYDAYYLKAQQVRTLIRQDFQQAFERVDVIALPTSPTPAFPIGERADDPLQMYLADVFTVSAPLAGLPALSIPCTARHRESFYDSRKTTPGVVSLPIGLQLIGRAWDEATILRAADAYERAAGPWPVPPGLD